MPHLFGDSTVFPYDVDYIDLARSAIDCAVQLMSAQHAISSAMDRAAALESARKDLIARVSTMTQNMKREASAVVDPDSAHLERVARRLVDCVESVASEEVTRIEQQAVEEISHTHNIVGRSTELARRAVESFLSRYDVPGTEVALTWAAAGEHDYAGQVSLQTPFGLVAGFSLGIPADHPWARPRRVQDVAPGLEIHFPQQSGWLSKRVEMAPVKLDKMFVSSVRLDAACVEFRLRKGVSSGTGYRVVVDLHGQHEVALSHLAEDGTPDGDPSLALDGEDSAEMLRLAQGIIASADGLRRLRRSMVSVELDGKPLEDIDWPRAVAERLIGCLAPVVKELARRSGAPGELVLRRDVGGGRREEVYVTQAELYEKLLVLPPERRKPFEPLGLCEPSSAPVPHRNARAGLTAQVAAAVSLGTVG